MIEERYRAGSTFLAVINNENEINSNYAKNLQALKKLVLVKYKEDIGVVPNESTWFGYYNEHGTEFPMEATKVYQNLGLKTMKDNGQLVLLVAPLGHLRLDLAWFIDNIIPLLKETWNEIY